MSVAQANRQRSPRHRARARGVIVRRHRRRLCTAISTNCRPRSNCTQRSCTQLGIISQDPIGFAAGDANLYRYVSNGPTGATDPSGLQAPMGIPSSIPVPPIPHQTIPWSVGRPPTPAEQIEDAKPQLFIAEVIISTVVEPYDWWVTGNEICDDPTNPIPYFGMLPFVPGAALKARRITVIGRMEELKQFDNVQDIDTWRKSVRIPGPDDPPVLWPENRDWLGCRIERGDDFGIATDPSILPPVRGGYVPGQPNGYFTAKELEYLRELGIEPEDFYTPRKMPKVNE